MTGLWRRWLEITPFKFVGKSHFNLQHRSLKMSSAKKPGKHAEHVREFIVLNKLGIHARPAAMFVKVANRYKCNILVEKDEEQVNGKSIMGLMMLAAGPGSKIIVTCDGEDCAEALTDIEALIARKFDEE